MIDAMPQHAWWHSITDGLTHQYPIDALPDDEGIVTAACGKEVMEFRVAREERGTYCSGCLVLIGTWQANRLEHLSVKLATEQRRELGESQ